MYVSRNRQIHATEYIRWHLQHLNYVLATPIRLTKARLLLGLQQRQRRQQTLAECFVGVGFFVALVTLVVIVDNNHRHFGTNVTVKQTIPYTQMFVNLIEWV